MRAIGNLPGGAGVLLEATLSAARFWLDSLISGRRQTEAIHMESAHTGAVLRVFFRSGSSFPEVKPERK